MVTDNTEYALVATRFSVPIGSEYVPLEDLRRSTRARSPASGWTPLPAPCNSAGKS